jgi:dihydrofolate synthase / folylpolyglutamate synthase
MEINLAYEAALEWIHGLGRFGNKPGLERMQALLEMLDNPHRKVPFIHIAGTNGKGSTAAMLASMLRFSGYRVGLYTSPFLLSFTNRLAVNNADIQKEELVDLVAKVKPLIEKIKSDPALGHPTEFEVVTVLAFAYFASVSVDFVVLEVGLGGRLDATNVVDPLLSIITNISLEHTDVLGDTIEKIAFEKAGIIKQGKPLLTAAEDQKALNVFKQRCAELNCKMYRVYPPLERIEATSPPGPLAILKKITTEGQYFDYFGFKLQLQDLFIGLRGRYQILNATTALAALELLFAQGFALDLKESGKGLAQTSWPGRLELLQSDPLVIMDGAHNPAAIEKLSEAIPDYFHFNRLILVIGILADKDMEAMLRQILPLADLIIFTRPTISRAAEPDSVADFARAKLDLQKEHLVIRDYRAALDRALELAAPDDAVLVTGSLYTVSDVRAHYCEHHQVLPGSANHR